MPEQRLPIIDGDDGEWGEILNQFVEKEHYNTGTDNTDNGQHKTVTIRPGTASAGTAPLKFTSGTLLSSPEAGAIEFLNDDLYFTVTTGAVRKTIAAYNDASGATGDVYYRDASGQFTRLGIGSSGDILSVSGGLPSWVTDTNVKLSGSQTVAGVKTFSSSPIVPAPTTDMQAATKKYVDDNGGVAIGDAIGSGQASAMLYLDSSSNLADDSIGVIKTTIDAGGGNNVYVNNLQPLAYSGGDISAGFVDATEIGGAKQFIVSNISTTNLFTWSNGATSIGTVTSDGIQLETGARINEFSTDGTLTGDSDTAVPTEKAVKTYVDSNAGGEVVDDTTPQLGGDLDLNGNDITGTGDINITGGLSLTSGDINLSATSTNRIITPGGSDAEPAIQIGPDGAGMVYEAGALKFVNSSQAALMRTGPALIYFAVGMQSYVNGNGLDISVGTGLGSRIYGTRRTGWTHVGYGFHATETYAPAVYSQNSGGTKQMNMWWGQDQETVAMGDLEIASSANGIILESPDATRWRVQVDNSGNLTTTAL